MYVVRAGKNEGGSEDYLEESLLLLSKVMMTAPVLRRHRLGKTSSLLSFSLPTRTRSGVENGERKQGRKLALLFSLSLKAWCLSSPPKLANH